VYENKDSEKRNAAAVVASGIRFFSGSKNSDSATAGAGRK
jgi:hypothetical protein